MHSQETRRLLGHYRTMRRIRCFEEAAEAASLAGEVRGAVHLSIGQEAVAAGVMAHLAETDVIATTHRGHGHHIAKGADTTAMMAELFGRAGGVCKGKGGSMHIADLGQGNLGANGVVAAGLPIAVGAAQGLRLRDSDAIVVCFFGDGAVNRGPFLEALNWAKIYSLPVLFVCEDNRFAATTATRSVTAGSGAGARAAAIGLPAAEVDGNDVEAVDRVAGDMVDDLRSGSGPRFLHAVTYRLKGHTTADKALYRDPDMAAEAWQHDPLAVCRYRLTAQQVTDAELDAVDAEATLELVLAVDAARAAPLPPPQTLFDDVQDVGHPAAWAGA